jgi:hypothetical protein
MHWQAPYRSEHLVTVVRLPLLHCITHTIDAHGDRGEACRAPDPSVDGFELEALATRLGEVDEWRNDSEVLRSQDSLRTRDGVRQRRTNHFRDNFDGFECTSTTLDEVSVLRSSAL